MHQTHHIYFLVYGRFNCVIMIYIQRDTKLRSKNC